LPEALEKWSFDLMHRVLPAFTDHSGDQSPDRRGSGQISGDIFMQHNVSIVA
jgi:hypothetical protein